MIKISRGRLDHHGRKIKPNAAWFARADAGIAKALRDGSAHKVSRSIYAHGEVKRALEELFYGKCVYCETDLHRWDWDVEHFRPKGRVFERSDHPGYFWICYDWL